MPSSTQMNLMGERGTTLSALAMSLPEYGSLDPPVVDRTALGGMFDIRMEWGHWGPAVDPDLPGPTFVEALQDQLGLKPLPAKVTLEVLVVDHVERPSKNQAGGKMRLAGVGAGLVMLAALSAGNGGTQTTVYMPPALAGQSATAVKVPGFDVVSVKPDKGDFPGMRMQITPDGFRATNVTLHQLLIEGFQVNPDQIVGEPGWASSAAFDIDAKVAGEDVAALKQGSFDQRRQMFQAILRDRFELTVRHETKELPVYMLTLAKGGSKMKEVKPLFTPDGPATGGPGGFSVGRGKFTGHATTMSFVVAVLSRQVGRTVVDKTGLTGNYDCTLTYAPEDGGALEGPPRMGRPGQATRLRCLRCCRSSWV